ncbi:hypothetical protein [Sphingomonas colocasiae]|uniref:Uncharacterized protein n=1 Tax=Sphingomonas colocasiae TaxID=1848973 RepID=A0ABS7PV23_9SPHN|nr:hypothetical protein [Sphingomonas colocasiae]MBY8823844.1 hypothetical protein [Sphingomonas colocasiae]
MTSLAYSQMWAAFSDYYELRDEFGYDDLVMYLNALHVRDQEDTEQAANQGTRRRDIYKLTNEFLKNASSIDRILRSMQGQVEAILDLLQDSPTLMEAVYDVNAGHPSVLFLPPELIKLYTFHHDLSELNFLEWIDELRAIPVRKKLPRGRFGQPTLQRAVAACRDYWIKSEGRSWTMIALKNHADKPTGPDRLTGLCEAFVFDILSCCGINFTLSQLATAWAVVDKAPGTPNIHARRGKRRPILISEK